MAVVVRSYSRMIGQTSLEQNTGIPGARLADQPLRLAFVRRIAIGMQQRDDDALGTQRDAPGRARGAG